MNKYFQNEIDSLRTIAQEFSQANPTLAPQLAQMSSDPDVERILEGVAFLTAGIRQKIDDDFPEFSQGLLSQIFPHYLRAIPSATIMEYRPTAILKRGLTMQSGMYMDSIEIDNVSCRYKSTCDVDVSPLTISSVQSSITATGRTVIDLAFSLNGMNQGSWENNDLRLHIGGDYQGAVDLFFILNNNLESISLLDSGGNEIKCPDVSIDPVGFNDELKLLDYPANAFPAYRLIQEYFLLKEKFLFIDVKRIGERIRTLPSSGFSLRFCLRELPMQLPKLSIDRFVLNAVPAVNLFEHDAESFVNDYRHSEYLLHPIRNTDRQYHIHSVDEVVGNNRKLGRKHHYTKMGLFDPDSNTSPVFEVFSRTGESGEASSYISFSYPKSFDLESKESVIVKLKCTNGIYAEKLKIGDITKKTSNSSELVDFSNITTPSGSQQAPSGNSILWRLISHLAVNYLSLAEADNLKSLLGLYIFSGNSGNEKEMANRKRIDSISDISVEPCDRLVGGIPMRGQTIKVTVNSADFSSKGDVYLFGMLLDRLMSSFSSLNSFTEFLLIDSATDEVYRWQLRAGDRPLI